MAAILDALGIERAVIGGLSLGGVMSLGFHAAYPAMTRALMLFDTGPGFRNPEARRAWNEQSLRRAEQLESRGLAALNRSDEVRLGEHRSADGRARGAWMSDPERRPPDPLAAHIAVPTLVLVGAEDTNFLAATDYMAAKISSRYEGHHSGRGARGEFASARGIQPRGDGISRGLPDA